ncbi:hypothetical protein GOP47_0008796 [Adiantum capillus-veneris]|uniref:DNA topoisomerase 2 n=1 Tax=Adiantum capillus-veneris TaxID=13818 RepID=A0A9D4UZJ7_ADICA|nr:hypothetical protein GOP47_0008796 [Adiantum capillus-veneris]
MAADVICYLPGLYKIFDEILVNAADNKQRDRTMDSLKVNIDVVQNTISVYNNGDGVPVEIREEGVYVPDLAKFGMTSLEDDVVGLMSKRALDLAGCLGKTVKVYYISKVLCLGTLLVHHLLASDILLASTFHCRIYERVNDRWEVCVSLSDGQFQQVSFVNSIATIRGGTHVHYVTEQKNKNAGVKAFQIENHMWVFVNALIDNPAFGSSTCQASPSSMVSHAKSFLFLSRFLKYFLPSFAVLVPRP